MRGGRGQATVEYAAVLALVAVALAGVGAAATGAGPSSIGGGVARALARALCVATGGLCDADVRPCVVAGDARAASWHVTVVVARVGEDEQIVRERRSDGTFALTRVRGRTGGLDLEVGLDAHVAGVGVELSASGRMLARGASGATWIARDAAEAARLEAALRVGRTPPGAVATFGTWGSRRSHAARAEALGAGVEASFAPSLDADTRLDTATGLLTVAVEGSREWRGSLLLGPLAGASLQRRQVERYAVVYGADGRPRELVVRTGGQLVGGVRLPAALGRLAGRLATQRGEGWSVESHLDLSDPEAARLAAGFVEEIRDPRPFAGSARRPSAALAALIEARAPMEARVFSVDERGSEHAAHAGVGVALGAGVGRGRTTTRLLAAASRGPDGAWRSREDCVEGPPLAVGEEGEPA